MTLTGEQFQAVTRYRFGVGPRPQSIGIVVPHITHAAYPEVLEWWAEFAAWMTWKDHARGKRPPVWRLVPLFAWQLRREILAARKAQQPPVPQPPAPPVMPPTPPLAPQYQNLIFAAQNPGLARAAKPKYKILVTADSAYDQYATAGDGVWFVPTEVSIERARAVAARIGSDLIVGQAETRDQFWATWKAGIRAVIGNLSDTVLDPTAVALVASGQMAYVNEFYWNQDRNRKPDNHNLPVASLCIAVYDAGPGSSENNPNGWGPQVSDYKAAGYVWPTMSAYGPGMTTDDYAALP